MAEWDPRSYLAEAAAAHLQSVDVHAAATTLVNYFDAITAHLEAADRHRSVASAIDKQRLIVEAEEEPTNASTLLRVTGVAFRVPFTVVTSTTRFTAAEVEAVLAECLLSTRAIFGSDHHTDRVVGFTGGAVVEAPDMLSDTQRINRASLNEPVMVHAAVLQMLQLSSKLHLTCRNFDPSVAPVMTVWRDALNQSTPSKPTLPRESMNALWAAVGISDAFAIDAQASTVTKIKSSMSALDFSAVAKGWAVDRIVERLSSLHEANGENHSGLLVEWGGDLRTFGVHPVTKEPWLVGVPQPPKLAELYSAWHAGEALPIPTLRHSLAMDPRGAAVAASGDYAQLFKFGYTHAMDVSTREPVKAQAHNVSGAVCVAPTCVEADGLATALWLQRSVLRALRSVQEIHRNNPDGADPLIHGPCLLRFYISERNNDAFIHDEDDGDDIGAGDAERLVAHDKESARQAALHLFSNEGAALRATQSDNTVTTEAKTKAALLGSDLRALASMRAAHMAVAVVRGVGCVVSSSPSVDFPRFHAATRCNAVLLSSVVPLPDQQHVVFNVMRGSGLFNHVREVGCRIGLHMLSSHDASQARCMLDNHGAWLASVRPITQDASDPSSPLFVADLFETAAVATVTFVTALGDHLLVVARHVPFDPRTDRDRRRYPLLRAVHQFATPAEPCEGVLATVGVLYAAHEAYGKVGIPIRGITVCSEAPPMLSFYAVASSVTAALQSSPPQIRWSGVSVAWLGNGADTFVTGRQGDAPPLQDEMDKTESFFAYLPFPSFREAPGLVATAHGDVVVAQSVGDSDRYTLLVVGLRSTPIEWSAWGARVKAACEQHVATTGCDDATVHAPLLSYEGDRHVRQLATV